MSKSMTINDLKFGDIVTTRDNKEWLFADNSIICEENNRGISVICFKDNLKNVSERDLDIMKVQRYVCTEGYFHTIQQCVRAFYELKTIYERKEEILDEEEKEYLKAINKQCEEFGWLDDVKD